MPETLALPPELVTPDYEKWTPWVELPDGTRARSIMKADPDSRLTDTDYWGTLHWPRRGDRQRPAECNGAARKMEARDGLVWWQPPTDVRGDMDGLANLERHVRGYLRGEWCFIGLAVEVETIPCEHCGERKRRAGSLWGIESNSDPSYFAEVIRDLVGSAE